MRCYCAKFKDILGMGGLFVPMYQRKYSWTSEEAYKFIDDLMHAADNTEKYFGSVVLKPIDGKMAIVDGQQRLLTSCLLLFAAKADEIDGISSVTLQPHMADKAEFERIQTELTYTSGTRMGAIFTLFRRMLSEDLDAARRCVEKLYNAVVTVTELGTEDDGAGVLESLNTSGRKMAESDLIRGMDFMRSTGDSEDYNALWVPFDEVIQECNVDSDELMARIMISTGMVRDRSYINSLGLFRAYTRAIEKEDYNFTREVNLYSQKALRANRFEFGQQFTSIVECMRQQPNVNLEYTIITTQIAVCEGDLKEEQGIELLTAINTYCVRAILCGESIETVNERISQAFSTDVEKTVYNLFYASRDEFKYLSQDIMKLMSYAGINERATIAYILKCLEIKNSRKPVDFTDANLATVVPTHYDESWDSVFGNRESYDLFNSRFGTSIINYVLVEDSIEFDNENAEPAIKALTKSKFSLTRGWAKQHDFSEEAATVRLATFAKLAAKMFAVPSIDTKTLLGNSGSKYIELAAIQKTTGLKATGVKIGSVVLDGDAYKVRCRTWKALCLYILDRVFDANEQYISEFASAANAGILSVKGESFASVVQADGMLEVRDNVFVSLPSQGQSALKRVATIISAVGYEVPVYIRLEK